MFSEDIEKIGKCIQSINPDIIFLQELTKNYHSEYPDTGRYLADLLGYESFYAYGPMVLPTGRPAQVGNGIFSKFPLLNTKKSVLQKGLVQEGRILNDERFYLAASVHVSGANIAVGTTHLPFHPRFQTTPLKQAMVEHILEQIPGGDYIFAGDLNTTPRTKAAVTFRRHGLKLAGPALRHASWTTKPFEIGPWAYEGLRWRLDYVFHKGRLKPVSSRLVATALSDHLPILVEFEQ